MHDINDMLFFAHVVKVRSFSAAARRLDVSKSRVSKAIARLESDLASGCYTGARAALA